jgi:hypothetical protein
MVFLQLIRKINILSFMNEFCFLQNSVSTRFLATYFDYNKIFLNFYSNMKHFHATGFTILVFPDF